MNTADATLDAAQPLTRTWVAKSLRIPLVTADLDVLALDLDGDGMGDNGLGKAYVALETLGTALFDPRPDGYDESVARGRTILLFDARAATFARDEAATGQALEGAAPSTAPCADESDLACARHLDGDTSFVPALAAPTHAPGTLRAGVLAFGPGVATMPVLVSSEPVWVPVARAHVLAELDSDGLTHGRFGGAIAMQDVELLLIPELHRGITARLEASCPGGTCEPESPGAELLALLDGDMSGTITLAEVQSSSLVQTLLGPDVDLDDDGSDDALSLTIGFEAVPASLREP
jgi:hypothetical protein